MRKSVCSLFLSLVVILSSSVFACAAQKPSDISASSAAAYDCSIGEFLFEIGSEQKRPIASTTKIMTALVVIEDVADLSERVRVDDKAVGIEGTSMYLKSGDAFTVLDLLYGVLLASGNDAACALAIYVGGSVPGFVKLMNNKARQLGLKNTHFANPSGLNDKNHFSTARDMAILASYALQNDKFKSICSKKSAVVRELNSGEKVSLYNHNRLLGTYDGCIGVKTGFTEASGRCLVSAAQRNGQRIVAVTLNAPDDWNDHRKMLDYAFSCLKEVVLPCKTASVPVVGGNKNFVAVSGNFDWTVPEGYEDRIYCKVDVPHFLYAPVKKGESLGEARFFIDGREIYSSQLKADEDIKSVNGKLTLFERIKNFFGRKFR